MSDGTKLPLIIGFVSDLMFASRIDDVANRLDFRVKWIEHTDQIVPPDSPNLQIPSRQYAEHLVGPGAVLLEKLISWQPALIIVDLNNSQIPWSRWVALIKSAPATRRIPVICFGSHKEVEVLKIAKNAGADVVLARSRFVDALPDLIKKYALLPDYERLQSVCQEALSDLAIEGIELFNRGEYFEAHELLEEAWNEDKTIGRELYRAVLQVAVAYLQIERGNYNGAVKMFMRVHQWIEPLPEICRSVDVAKLREDARNVYDEILNLGPENLGNFNRELLKPVRYKSSP